MKSIKTIIKLLIVICIVILYCKKGYCSKDWQSYTITFNDPLVKAGEEVIIKVKADSGPHVYFTKIIIKLKYDTSYLSYIDGEYSTCDNDIVIIERDKFYNRVCNFEIKFKALKEGITDIKVRNYEMYNNWGNTQWCDSIGTSHIKIVADPDYKNIDENDNYAVKQGESLWSIAKEYYGDGRLYIDIWNANSDTILNPRIIYPNQKLIMP